MTVKMDLSLFEQKTNRVKRSQMDASECSSNEIERLFKRSFMYHYELLKPRCHMQLLKSCENRIFLKIHINHFGIPSTPQL